MKTVKTKSGNFVLVSDNEMEMPISRPYLNRCDLPRREEKEKKYAEYNIQQHYEEHYKEGMFQGYDHGHDLGINDPFAKEILNSNVLRINP
jgi:hypothetical protein